jgi:flagellar motor component MotA
MFDINLFQIVITMAIGCILSENSIKDLKNSKESIEKIYDKFKDLSQEQIKTAIYDAYNKLRITLFPDNSSLQKYIEEGLLAIQNHILQAYQIKKLDKIFII